MHEQVIALVAIFNNDGEVLLLKRPKQAHQGGLWSFPGGKVEGSEMPLDTAIRELKEETALSGKLWRHIVKSSFTYPDKKLHFLIFGCLAKSVDELNCSEKHVWTSIHDLDDYPMPAANGKFMRYIEEAADFYTNDVA
jgi:mutator protein MutT